MDYAHIVARVDKGLNISIDADFAVSHDYMSRTYICA